MNRTRTVAVLGANGFIGNRLVEMLRYSDRQVRPIARRASALALASRFGLDGRVADTFDRAALGAALADCDVVVHAMAGDTRMIVDSIAPVYQAAADAGCHRMIYLSSAMVHGQAPKAECNETTPLPRGQGLSYNRAKRSAERRLFSLGKVGPVEVTALRPGIVYGPRSQWIGGLADALINERAALVDGGSGLCNSIYIDNLVHAIMIAADAPAAVGEAFLVGENETPDWGTFYSRVARALGIPLEKIATIGFSAEAPSILGRIDFLRQSHQVRAALKRLPAPLREGLAAAWQAAGLIPQNSLETGPVANLEMALLHRARHVPQWTKARDKLGYAPVVSPGEAWVRTISWLAFAGYPVVSQCPE